PVFIGKIVHRADDAQGPAALGSAAVLLGDARGRARVRIGFDVAEFDVAHALSEHTAYGRLGGFGALLCKLRRKKAAVAHEPKDDRFLILHRTLLAEWSCPGSFSPRWVICCRKQLIAIVARL